MSLVKFAHHVLVAGLQLKRYWLLIAAALIAGWSSFGIQYAASRPLALDNAVSEFASANSEFTVLDEPRRFGSLNSYRVSVRLDSAELQGRIFGLAARGELRGGHALSKLKANQVVSCRLEFRPTKSNQRAGFAARCKDELVTLKEANNGQALVQQVRSAFLANIKAVTKDAGSLVAGLAIGETGSLSDGLKQDMKVVSLTHLTAVSGANCAIVLALVYFLIKRLGGGRWLRMWIGLFTLFAYVALVGAQPSVLRAAVMAGAVLVAISLGRKTAPMNALALSVIILLVADPWLATDFGFALSVAATAGLLIITEPIATKLARHMPRWLALSIAVAVSAQIFCLPILLQLQGGLATFALPANILAEPLVAPVTVLAIIAVVVAVPLPWLAGLLTYTASFGTAAIENLAHYFASLDNSNLSWPAGIFGFLSAVALLLSALLWLRAEPTNLRNLGIGLLVVIFAASAGSFSWVLIKQVTWPMKNWQVVACDVGQGDALVIRSENLIALVDVGRDVRPIDQCLSKLGVKQIDLLVLTHFDMDHVGGLEGAVEGRKVGNVLISPFKDERWGATGTNLYLQAIGAKIIPAEKDMQGSLGNYSWKVLSPNRNAQGAEDSNDASVVMLWNLGDCNLLTMADLGERGQMRMSSGEAWWQDPILKSLPLVLKVSHHGSADQYPELIEALEPDLALISVGVGNSYGHPTQRTLGLLKGVGAEIARTDLQGTIAVASSESGLAISNSPHG